MRRVGLFLFLVGVIAACGKEEQEPSTTVTAREPAPYLVDADWLRRHRDDVVVVDMQSKRELYEKGHIPGAIHLEVNDLRTDEKLLKPRKELE
jgi:3-mercaptopyruvate sulfurtransferase SseA